jgi:hypothetical protein
MVDTAAASADMRAASSAAHDAAPGAAAAADAHEDAARQAAWDGLTDVERTGLKVRLNSCPPGWPGAAFEAVPLRRRPKTGRLKAGAAASGRWASGRQTVRAAPDSSLPPPRHPRQVALWRARAAETARHPGTGAPLFADPVTDAVVARAVPPGARAELEASRAGVSGMDWTAWMAARTAEVDKQVLAAAAAAAGAAPPGARLQIVILGAGFALRRGTAAGLLFREAYHVRGARGRRGRAGARAAWRHARTPIGQRPLPPAHPCAARAALCADAAAGLDARAWRLAWPAPKASNGGGGGPPGPLLIEVDTPPVLSLKRRAFHGFAVHASLGARRELARDLTDTEGRGRALWQPAAGHGGLGYCFGRWCRGDLVKPVRAP